MTLYIPLKMDMILEPIRLRIDTLVVFNDQIFEETVSVHKYFSRADTVGVDLYPSGVPYSIYTSPVELKFPSGEPYLGRMELVMVT